MGSSPLTRGKRCLRLRMGRRHGLIPAHAGKTPRPARCYCAPRAHPRSRGENEGVSIGASIDTGSSPLTRGKRCASQCTRVRRRLIPAHAGKTRGKTKAVVRTGAHPRSRGENVDSGVAGVSENGSSPLTRGKLGPRVRVRIRRGLIPAHAGKTTVRKILDGMPRAHPRSRGENS